MTVPKKPLLHGLEVLRSVLHLDEAFCLNHYLGALCKMMDLHVCGSTEQTFVARIGGFKFGT